MRRLGGESFGSRGTVRDKDGSRTHAYTDEGASRDEVQSRQKATVFTFENGVGKKEQRPKKHETQEQKNNEASANPLRMDGNMRNNLCAVLRGRKT